MKIDLALLAVAALIGVALQAYPDLSDTWVRAIAAVLLAVALLAKLANRLQSYDAQWFDGRAVAETGQERHLALHHAHPPVRWR